MSAGPTHTKKSRRIFWLFLVPLLCLIIMQAALSFGTVLLGGAFSTIRNYALDRLKQVTETRGIILENDMTQRWTALEEEYDVAGQLLAERLAADGMSLDDFLRDADAQEAYFIELFPTWSYMLRKNSTTGAFIILGRPDAAGDGGVLNALYIRDSDPDTNPADYSDLLLTVGPSQITKDYRVPFDLYWKTSLSLKPYGESHADDFFYQPYLTAGQSPEARVEDCCYWSTPFCLEGREDTDPYRMITYSIPLRMEDGTVYGVMGIEISLTRLASCLPYREVNANHEGGYLLLARQPGDTYRVVCATGLYSGDAIGSASAVVLSETAQQDLYRLERTGGQDEVYLTLNPLTLYNTNTPFYEQGWCLAGMETRDALLGVSYRLTGIFIAATLFALAVAIFCSYLLVRYITNPIRRLSACIQTSPENELKPFAKGAITEIDELYDTIFNLTNRQRKIEWDLLEEKERYRLVLRNSSDILVTYDPERDLAIFYNLESGNAETHVEHLMEKLEQGDYIHPVEKRVVLARIRNIQTELSVSFRTNWGTENHEYQWFELTGRILPDTDGRRRTFIGSMHNIHDRKVQELAERESLHKDSLTGLYLRASGEDIVRSQIRGGHGGCLLLADVRDFLQLNEEYGMVVGDVILEELGRMLVDWKEKSGAEQSVLIRYGGDEFMLWLEDCSCEEAAESIEELRRTARTLYADGGLELELVFGGAVCGGTDYDELVMNVRRALSDAVRHNLPYRFYHEMAADDSRISLRRTTPVEHTDTDTDNVIPVTFGFFDKSDKIEDILTILLPKLGRHFEAEEVALIAANRAFSTVKATHCWHLRPGTETDHELLHYTAQEFDELDRALWEERPAWLPTARLDEGQRRFLRIGEGREGYVFPLYDNNNYTGALLFLRDAQAQTWTEEQAGEILEVVKIIEVNINRQRYDTANRAKSDFLSRMSHEIRTPMNAIIGMAYIAQTHTEDAAKVSEDLAKITQSSQYLLGLINDILDMSRIESGKLTLEQADFDLNDMTNNITTLIRPQAEAKSITFETDISLTCPQVTGDSLHLNQVLINLLGNAIKFTPAEGSVRLTIRQEGDRAFFSVRDTGIGVSPENQSRIFESFEQAEGSTTRKYGGTGLGLAISSRLVQMMGGSIELDSEIGKGSDFYFTITLPVNELRAQSAAQAQPEERQPVSAAGLRILLVEDNDLNIEIAKTILEMQEAEVELAHNGKEAVDMFLAGEPDRYDLILMDIQMPVMDGLEATRIIRRSGHPRAATIPIIAMTANAFDEDMKKSVESGMNGHLSKPIDIDKFLQTIAEFVTEKA